MLLRVRDVKRRREWACLVVAHRRARGGPNTPAPTLGLRAIQLSLSQQRLPRNLILFWHDLGSIPASIRAAVDRTRARHPGFQILFADDTYMAGFIRSRYGDDVLRLYVENTIPASRCDIARMMLLIEHGGIYIDAKLELLRPIESAVAASTELWLVRRAGGIVNNLLGAVPRHPIIERTLEVILRNLRNGYFNRFVPAATGPLCLTRVVESSGVSPSTELADFHALHGALFSMHSVPGVRSSWVVQQVRGIYPRGAPGPALEPWPAIPRDEPEAHASRHPELTRLLSEEEDYLGTLPFDTTGLALNLPEPLRSHVNERFTGSPERSWLEDLAGRGPFRRIALVTLGSEAPGSSFLEAAGAESLTVYSPSGLVRERIGRDLSGSGAMHVEVRPCELNRLRLPPAGFDLVLTCLCLHRVFALESVLEQIASSLGPAGCFALLEYVGEDRFQFSARRLAWASRAVRAVGLPAEIDLGSDFSLTAPGPCEVGPCGGARSSEMLQVAEDSFERVHRGDAGVLLLPLLLGLSWPLSERLEPAIPALLERERALHDAGERGAFVYGVYAARGAGSDRR
jgi:SAM-dependent methyltransferase